MSGRLMGRLRPALAVGVLSLALVTACSSGDDDATSSAPSSTVASESSEADTSAPSSDASGEESESAAAPSDEESAESGTSGAAPTDAAEPTDGAADPGTQSAAPTGESADPSAGGDAGGGTGGDTGGDDATEGTTCNGLTVAAVNGVLNGVTVESAIDTTIDDPTGESSCIFGTTTTIDTIAVDRYPLDTYLGGELAGLGDAEVLDAVAEGHVMAQTEVESTDNVIGRLNVRTLTGTDLTGGANALSYTVQDGVLVAVSVAGPAFADSLADTSTAVLELALG